MTEPQHSQQQVYILGTVSEGAAGAEAIAHWVNPNTALLGFGLYTNVDDGFVDPTDGTLVFSESKTTYHRFREDACGSEDTLARVPADPLANDDPISFPCGLQAGKQRILSSADGVMALSCGAQWLISTGCTGT